MSETTSLAGFLVQETDKARCILINGVDIWIPRSVVKHTSINRSSEPPACTLEVEDWWVRKNNLDQFSKS